MSATLGYPAVVSDGDATSLQTVLKLNNFSAENPLAFYMAALDNQPHLLARALG